MAMMDADLLRERIEDIRAAFEAYEEAKGVREHRNRRAGVLQAIDSALSALGPTTRYPSRWDAPELDDPKAPLPLRLERRLKRDGLYLHRANNRLEEHDRGKWWVNSSPHHDVTPPNVWAGDSLAELEAYARRLGLQVLTACLTPEKCPTERDPLKLCDYCFITSMGFDPP